MPIYTPGKLILRKTWQPMDSDAAAYITAVETADGQSLEEATKRAIDNFVLGCKEDGIWNAIKASCILAGARTLAGCLVPLVGTAPTKNGTEGGWSYNRKTGLNGNGTNNYLDSNRSNSAQSQNSIHIAVWKGDTTSGTNPYYIGAASAGPTIASACGQGGMYLNSAGFVSSVSPNASSIGLHGINRTNSSTVDVKRPNEAVSSFSLSSASPPSANHYVYNLNANGTPGATQWSASKLSFYSIGDSINLTLLNNRVTDLMTALGAAIP